MEYRIGQRTAASPGFDRQVTGTLNFDFGSVAIQRRPVGDGRAAGQYRSICLAGFMQQSRL